MPQKKNLRIIVKYIGTKNDNNEKEPILLDVIKKLGNTSLNPTFTDFKDKSVIIETKFLNSADICAKIIQNMIGKDWVAIPEVI